MEASAPDHANPRRTPVARLWRSSVLVAAPVLVIVTLGLSLSDRVPGQVHGWVDRLHIDWLIPSEAFGVSGFTAGHFALWAAVCGVFCLAVGRTYWVGLVGAVTFSASVMVEFFQSWFTSSRALERVDILANLAGVTVAAIVAFALLWWNERHERAIAS